MLTLKNRGKFELSWNFINKDPELVAEIFSRLRIVPVRCEVLFLRDAICYEAISENFPPALDNCQIPEYWIETSSNEHGELDDVKFVPRPARPAGGKS